MWAPLKTPDVICELSQRSLNERRKKLAGFHVQHRKNTQTYCQINSNSRKQVLTTEKTQKHTEINCRKNVRKEKQVRFNVQQ